MSERTMYGRPYDGTTMYGRPYESAAKPLPVCTRCNGLGEVRATVGTGVLEHRCSRCDGSGVEPAGPAELHDRGASVTIGVYPRERTG